VLKQRLITAGVLVSLLTWSILALPDTYLALLLSIFIIIAAWEWAGFFRPDVLSVRLGYSAVISALLAYVWFQINTNNMLIIISIAFVWWLLIFGYLIRTTMRSNIDKGNNARGKIIKGFAGIIVLVPAWSAMVFIHQSEQLGPYYLIFLFVLISMADTGAYIAGKRWGTHKLAPVISPGKTWEGVFGMLLVVVIAAIIGGFLLGESAKELVFFVPLCVGVAVFSIAGDLLESVLKRSIGKKDSGSILPGHGGMLDRIDSLTASAPVFLLGMFVLNNSF